MISAVTWILMTTIYFNDGNMQHFTDRNLSREVCLNRGIYQWTKFFENRDIQKNIEVFCVQRKHHYDFFSIVCSEPNVCEIK